jgi:hypothetical protein
VTFRLLCRPQDYLPGSQSSTPPCMSLTFTLDPKYIVHPQAALFVRASTEPASLEASSKIMKEALNVGMPRQDRPFPAHSHFLIASLTGTGARTRDLLFYLHHT